MNTICKFCNKDKKQKTVLNNHLYKSFTKCRELRIIKDMEEKHTKEMNEIKEQCKNIVMELKITYKDHVDERIKKYEKDIQDRDYTINVALKEAKIHMTSKDEQIIKLENHIKEMTSSLINKPTYSLNVNTSLEDYMKSKNGINLSVLQCLEPKESKKIDLLVFNGKYDNYESYDYYNLLCSLIGQKVLLENIVVTDKKRGVVCIKYNNKTEYMSRTRQPMNATYELGKINELIENKVEPSKRKYINSNEFYMNKLRLSLTKQGECKNRLWGDVKENMVVMV